MKPTLLLLSFLILSCQDFSLKNDQSNKNLTSYVNTFVGTGGHGHTYPGATLPFGMMQLSPDTRLDGWDGCSGTIILIVIFMDSLTPTCLEQEFLIMVMFY